MRLPAWEGDWQQRIEQRIRERGFASVTAFADSRPLASLVALAKELGAEDVAAVQLQRMMCSEAERAGSMERFARSMLVRELVENMPDGWGVSRNYDYLFARASVFAEWINSFPDEFRDVGKQLWDAFKAQDIPTGWLPSGVDDRLIVGPFERVPFRPS